MTTKICFKCNTEKMLPEFYKHPAMSDGHLGKCKDCTKSDTKKHCSTLILNEDWIEKERERHRDKYYRLGYKDKHKPTKEKKKAIMDRYNKKYPEKYKAKILSAKLSTTHEGNNLHHWSYNIEHAKDVIELSTTEHSFLHRFIVYDQETKMYKTKSGELLNTKEKHLEYYYLLTKSQVL